MKSQKEEIKPKKEVMKSRKEEIKPKKEEIKQNKTELPRINKQIEVKKEQKLKEEKKPQSKVNEIKIEESKINKQKMTKQINKEEKKNEPHIEELKLEPVHFKGFEDPKPLNEANFSHKIAKEKEPNNKLSNEKTEKLISNQLPKTLLTKKTEDNYQLMMDYFKSNNYKRGDDNLIDNLINYGDFSSDEFLGLASDKIKRDNNNKSIVDDFLQRNKDDTKLRQNNNKRINDRIKSIDDSNNKKLHFDNRQSQQEYFDSFYKKQIQYKNNYKDNLDKLVQKYDEEKKKNYIPEPKNKNNLEYFKNNEPVQLSKYCLRAKQNKNNLLNNNNEQNVGVIKNLTINENENCKENEIQKNESNKLNIKKLQSFDPNKSNSNISQNNNNNDGVGNNNKNGKGGNKKLKKVKSGPLLKSRMKLTKKEIEDLTNKLHYDGELLKIKKQEIINDDLLNNSNYHNFSKEKLTHSSIIILIKKILYEYSTSIKKNAYSDYVKNPKLNYEQYIDIFKDLYYIDKDAPPEEYLDEDSIYKELWNKLILFSNGPENSIESNVLLIYLLELNGFFSNEKIIKELENEIYWIKLNEYDDLLANAKYIENNWNDLKMAKIKNIKRLKLEGKYNPIHSEEIYYNYLINNSINGNNSKNINRNHFITTFKGNTNYHFIHGYHSKNKDNENSFYRFSNSFSIIHFL